MNRSAPPGLNRLVNGALWALLQKGHARFQDAVRDPRATQEAVLLDMVRAHAGSRFGRAHGFGRIRSAAEFRSAVPPGDYVSLNVERDPRALVDEPVLLLQPTGGSTGSSKLIPFTAGLRRRFQAGLAAWYRDLLAHVPGLWGGSTWWQVTPPGLRTWDSAGGLPIGFADDADYFGPMASRCVRALSAVPPEIGRMTDLEEWRTATLTHLLARRDLALLSVWNPSFLQLFLEHALSRWEPLVAAVARLDPGRADALHRAARMKEPIWTHVWPRLRLVSCWGDGPAARDMERLRALLPTILLQPKGLLATEAFVSLPLIGHEGHALAAHAFFLEFESEGRILEAWQLDQGFVGDVVVTNGGGLWRYRLRDRVEVLGHVGRLPLIRFLGRSDATCDLRGEKLHDGMVARAVALALGSAAGASFTMLAPDTTREPPCYVLYAQTPDPEAVVAAVETALRASLSYDYARRLGQLGPVRAWRIPPDRDARAIVLERSRQEGLRLGEIKPATLDRREGWETWFGGGDDSSRRSGRQTPSS